MGKVLIIKDADFSDNSVDNDVLGTYIGTKECINAEFTDYIINRNGEFVKAKGFNTHYIDVPPNCTKIAITSAANNMYPVWVHCFSDSYLGLSDNSPYEPNEESIANKDKVMNLLAGTKHIGWISKGTGGSDLPVTIRFYS